eukprot:GHVU01229343.1.p1 GENE.GHVU01229343.1~~GHVU01229343.1.p1  ORF type:complete len:224 (-),score=6.93 GHVU01229343.1:169-780(-)
MAAPCVARLQAANNSKYELTGTVPASAQGFRQVLRGSGRCSGVPAMPLTLPASIRRFTHRDSPCFLRLFNSFTRQTILMSMAHALPGQHLSDAHNNPLTHVCDRLEGPLLSSTARGKSCARSPTPSSTTPGFLLLRPHSSSTDFPTHPPAESRGSSAFSSHKGRRCAHLRAGASHQPLRDAATRNKHAKKLAHLNHSLNCFFP